MVSRPSEMLGSLIVLFTAVLAVTAVATSNVDVGFVGIVLSYALSVAPWFIAYGRQLVCRPLLMVAS